MLLGSRFLLGVRRTGGWPLEKQVGRWGSSKVTKVTKGPGYTQLHLHGQGTCRASRNRDSQGQSPKSPSHRDPAFHKDSRSGRNMSQDPSPTPRAQHPEPERNCEPRHRRFGHMAATNGRCGWSTTRGVHKRKQYAIFHSTDAPHSLTEPVHSLFYLFLQQTSE